MKRGRCLRTTMCQSQPSSSTRHARHTTTNLRNAAREIYRYDISHGPSRCSSSAIRARSARLRARASPIAVSKELGYLPYRLVNQAL